MENIVHDHTATVTLRCSLDPIRVISKSPYLAAHFQPLFHHTVLHVPAKGIGLRPHTDYMTYLLKKPQTFPHWSQNG